MFKFLRRFFRPGVVGCAIVSSLVLVFYVAATSAEEVRRPSEIPQFKQCSGEQKKLLRAAYKKAHSSVWRAKQLIKAIKKWPSHERAALWERDHVNQDYSVSPHTWFGSYDSGRLTTVLKALEKAEKRFRDQGSGKIRKIRCRGLLGGVVGTRDVDQCPGTTALVGKQAAYHLPLGTIVMCDNFWGFQNNAFYQQEVRDFEAARIIIHEVFHWLSLDNGAVATDYHSGRGIQNGSYATPSLSRKLARDGPKKAIKNVESYASFAVNIGHPLPHVSALWQRRQGGSSGDTAYALAMSWDNLLTYYRLRKGTMSLMDVETYVFHGQRRYTGLWHKSGRGSAAIWRMNTPESFAEKWVALGEKNELVDLEIYKAGDHLKFLGVWRKKRQGADPRPGAFHHGVNWNTFTSMWRAGVPSDMHLTDIESYVDIDGVRKFAGVWRVKRNRSNGDRGELWGFADFNQFEAKREELQSTHILVDMERYFENGNDAFIGIWRRIARTGSMMYFRDIGIVEREIQRRKANSILIDLDYDVDLPQRVPRP